jgi:hypothetical protein
VVSLQGSGQEPFGYRPAGDDGGEVVVYEHEQLRQVGSFERLDAHGGSPLLSDDKRGVGSSAEEHARVGQDYVRSWSERSSASPPTQGWSAQIKELTAECG